MTPEKESDGNVKRTQSNLVSFQDNGMGPRAKEMQLASKNWKKKKKSKTLSKGFQKENTPINILILAQ